MGRYIGLITIVVAASALGCTDDDDAEEATTTPADGTVVAGPVLSVAEAMASEQVSELLVSGFIVAVDDDIQLCSALAESFPPQCGGESLRVEGLDLASLDATQTEGETTWTDEPVQVLGAVDDNVLTVEASAVR